MADAIARGERSRREVDRIQGLASGFREDAERGDAEAQYNLGNSYDFGMGVEQDHAQAVEWYAKSADRGYAGARTTIEKMCEKDDLWKHVEKAAEAGSATAWRAA